MKQFITQAVIMMVIAASSVMAQDEAAKPGLETDKIEAAIQSYIAAFNARDVKKLVAHWTPDGVYISRTSGERSEGREAMAKEFTAMLAGDKVPKLASTTRSIEFISPNVALERGSATVTHTDGDVIESDYTAVYMKIEGTWLIDRVTEDEVVVTPSNYEHLKGLEWLVGEWVDAGEGFTIDINCHWTKNQNFIARRFEVSNEAAGVESSGLQIIGWDAKLKTIRSWLFDSDGGVITGTWTEDEGEWSVRSVATLADGATGSFTTILRPLEDGNHTWQKINRVVDSELLPNIDEIIVQRR